jgi:ATP-dependent RNA helicase DeaD
MMDSLNKFQELALASPLLAALDHAGYQIPTPIQAAFIPEAVTGRDVIGQAQTGTGKTAAFLLPIMQGLRDDVRGPQALVLGPTRELVVQIAAEAEKLSYGLAYRSVAIYGGQRMRLQLNDLRKGAQIVIGTPGRLLDHLRRGTLRLDSVRYVVLDEADRMLDIGFRPDIERILRQCPGDRRYMRDPIMIDVSPKTKTVESIRQRFISVDQDRKFDLLLKVIDRERPRQCIIFCQTKRGADQLYSALRKVHKRAAVMHGDLQQSERDRIMAAFRDSKLTCLVATDVVARGIDVTGISHIINYDLPEDSESYVHRIGRTGRMGADGVAIAFATPEEGKKLTAIEVLISQIIEEDRFDDFEAVAPRPSEEKQPTAPAFPVFGRRVRRYSRAL